MEQLLNSNEEELSLEAPNFSINTGYIFYNEQDFWMYPGSQKWPKYSDEIARSLKRIIQELLVAHTKPEMSHSEERKEYLVEKFERSFDTGFSFNTTDDNINPLRRDFFVLAYDVPMETLDKPVVYFSGTGYYYLFNYGTPLTVTKQMVAESEFELLFAFSLRQCDL